MRIIRAPIAPTRKHPVIRGDCRQHHIGAGGIDAATGHSPTIRRVSRDTDRHLGRLMYKDQGKRCAVTIATPAASHPIERGAVPGQD